MGGNRSNSRAGVQSRREREVNENACLNPAEAVKYPPSLVPRRARGGDHGDVEEQPFLQQSGGAIEGGLGEVFAAEAANISPSLLPRRTRGGVTGEGGSGVAAYAIIL